jgi:glutamate synthase (NADPH/NADH) large chain
MYTEYHIGAGFPQKQALYDPQLEKDACGVGFIADLNGTHTRATVADALEILRRLAHRGACGCDEKSGDGAGIMVGMPHKFLLNIALAAFNKPLPPPGKYAVGNCFLPKNKDYRNICQQKTNEVFAQLGLEVVGWRDVPVDASDLGKTAKLVEPFVSQIFVFKPESFNEHEFENSLYIARQKAASAFGHSKPLYFCSLSPYTLVYKGQLTPEQLENYYLDLKDDQFTSYLAMVHSRFSTNTFPSWERAQPFRYMCHNGEINTLRGNVNWMKAREGTMQSKVFERDLESVYPIIDKQTSDSGMFDNVLEFFIRNGREVTESVMMMIPEAWQNDANMPSLKKDFYEFHSTLMEPWDGPALVAFSNGKYIGAVLDRNGLRPGRYYVTEDNRVVCASEVGVIDVSPDQVKLKGRLRPGHMFLIDVIAGRIISDEEIKFAMASKKPYGKWLSENRVTLSSACISSSLLEEEINRESSNKSNLLCRLHLFGFTSEVLEMLLEPMGSTGYEALGSMGNDSPLACLSLRPRNVFEYFRQLFAQVINPPIDPIREKIVTSLTCPIGPEGNILDPSALCARRIS